MTVSTLQPRVWGTTKSTKHNYMSLFSNAATDHTQDRRESGGLRDYLPGTGHMSSFFQEQARMAPSAPAAPKDDGTSLRNSHLHSFVAFEQANSDDDGSHEDDPAPPPAPPPPAPRTPPRVTFRPSTSARRPANMTPEMLTHTRPHQPTSNPDEYTVDVPVNFAAVSVFPMMLCLHPVHITLVSGPVVAICGQHLTGSLE